eukprot:1433130-Amphidinium_carterae.1
MDARDPLCALFGLRGLLQDGGRPRALPAAQPPRQVQWLDRWKCISMETWLHKAERDAVPQRGHSWLDRVPPCRRCT